MPPLTPPHASLTPAVLLCPRRMSYPTAQPGRVPGRLDSFFPNSPALLCFAAAPPSGSWPDLPFSEVPGPLRCTQVESIFWVP